MRFYAVMLYTKNFNEMTAFYKDKVGLKVRMEDIENEFIEFKLSDKNILTILSDSSIVEMCELENVAIMNNTPALHGFVAEDVESEIEALKDKGVDFFIDLKITSWGQNVAYFKDPDGNIWEIGDDSELS